MCRKKSMEKYKRACGTSAGWECEESPETGDFAHSLFDGEIGYKPRYCIEKRIITQDMVVVP